MSYRLLSNAEKRMNRHRAMQHFSWLMGVYHDFCHVFVHEKTSSGKYVYKYPQEQDKFMANFTPMIEFLCGKYYTEGVNPDVLPHPVRMAMEWHNGRKIKDTIMQIWPEKARLIPMVKERCDKLGIKLTAPESEYVI